MTLIVEHTPLEGLVLVRPKIYADHRGHFYESFNESTWKKEGLPSHFVQENRSFSVKNTVRGLHFQVPPHGQGKLVQVLHGRALDVVVDIRKNSPSFGKSYSILLSHEEIVQMYVPLGFAHGFYAIEDTIFNYKCTSFYEPSAERSIQWNDPDLNIEWGIEHPILSPKDFKGINFNDFISPF